MLFDYNRYLYVRGNPLKYTDPSGHLSEDEIRKYYGYEGDDRDSLRQAMLADGWNEDLADWLLDPETEFGEVISYYDESGSQVGNAMLALFEASEGTYTGGFYGLSGASRGMRVLRSHISSFKTSTPDATSLEELYRGAYHLLPRKSGSDGRNYYDPAVYKDWGSLATLGYGAGIAGMSTTAGTLSVSGCAVPWACALLVSLTMLGLASAPEPVTYPVLLQPNTGGIGNPPDIARFGPPRGVFQ